MDEETKVTEQEETQPIDTQPEVATEIEEKAEPEKKYTDDDLDRIISAKFAKWQEKKEAEIDQAKQLAEMNEQQKAEFERDQYRKELDELKKANTLNQMSKTARSILSDNGYNVSDTILSHLVSTDANETKEAVDDFVTLLKAEVEKAVKEQLKSPAPKRGGSAAKMSREEILQIKDPAERQNKILENIELFK